MGVRRYSTLGGTVGYTVRTSRPAALAFTNRWSLGTMLLLLVRPRDARSRRSRRSPSVLRPVHGCSRPGWQAPRYRRSRWPRRAAGTPPWPPQPRPGSGLLTLESARELADAR